MILPKRRRFRPGTPPNAPPVAAVATARTNLLQRWKPLGADSLRAATAETGKRTLHREEAYSAEQPILPIFALLP